MYFDMHVYVVCDDEDDDELKKRKGFINEVNDKSCFAVFRTNSRKFINKIVLSGK